MTPHLWVSALSKKRGQWACASKRRATASTSRRVYYPVGDIYYGSTPLEAYNKWRTYNVGSA